MSEDTKDALLRQADTELHEENMIRLLEEERDMGRQRLSLALRDTFTEIYELDLEADTSILLFSNSALLSPVCGAAPVSNKDIIAVSLHPADREPATAFLRCSRLRAFFAAGAVEATTEFRRLIPGQEQACWVSALVVPLPQAMGEKVLNKALFFIKDISLRKSQEEQRRVLEQYGLALRTIYDIFFEFNVEADTYRLVHLAKDKFVAPPPSGSLQKLLVNASSSVVHPRDRKHFDAFFSTVAIHSDFAAGRKLRMGEFRVQHEDGMFHWVGFTLFPLEPGGRGDERCLVFGVDIQDRKLAEEITAKNLQLEQLRAQDERYRIVVEQTATMIFECSADVCYVAPKLVERFAGIYDGRDVFDIWRQDRVIHPHDLPRFATFMDLQGQQDKREMTVRLLQRSGTYVWCRVTVTDLATGTAAQRHCLGTLNDVDEASRAVRSLRKKAERDGLTGVFNMRTFCREAESRIRENPERLFYVIRMDIDGFKVINDLYGQDEGDRLLRKLALALQSRMNGVSVCGRVGADVFCACVDFDKEGIERLVREIADTMAGNALPSTVMPSFGICRVDSVGTPVSVLCDWANLALKTVKGNAITLHAFYDETLRQGMLKDKGIESEMREALARGEFQLYYQPKVHIASGRIVGAEGLVRWEHPRRGTIAPDDFIPLFEKNGFIVPLDEYVWEEACKTLRSWILRGIPAVPLSVNVSRMHIHDMRFCDKLEGMVAVYGVPVNLLELELTESVFLDNRHQTFASINRLKERGFSFSLDDFGAGYSSLNILKNLPVSTLKLDQGFLDEAESTGKGKAIVQGVIALAKSIDMEVLAEGVRSLEQAVFLRESGCELAQGFYYARPVPLAEFERMLEMRVLP